MMFYSLTWQLQVFASRYSYCLASIVASGWQFLKKATVFVLAEWIQTGWCDLLYGNFQSDISLESQRPQQDITLTLSQHSCPLESVWVTLIVYSRRWQPNGGLFVEFISLSIGKERFKAINDVSISITMKHL